MKTVREKVSDTEKKKVAVKHTLTDEKERSACMLHINNII